MGREIEKIERDKRSKYDSDVLNKIKKMVVRFSKVAN